MKKILRRLKRAIHNASASNSVPIGHTEMERARLAGMPRYVETTTDLPGFKFKIPDAASFLASWEEIFDREIYNFSPTNDTPRILDCGANVGVSALYFRKHFPKAKITAFEPDPKIFAYLQANLSGNAATVELVAKGVWSSNATLRFQSEGADAGRIDSVTGSNVIEISTVRLRDYLNEDVDFLKIDIEGAETEVLLDIAPCLQNVRNIFVEYHSFAGQPQTLGKLIQTLIEAGFRIQVHPMKIASQPFIEVNSHLGMDMQLNIYGYRIESKP